MRVALAVAAALVATLGAGAAQARVLIVGIDGASWNVIDGMIAEGELPNLAGIARDGIEAELATVEPVVSPVVWSSVATGRSPENHGVGGFLGTRLILRVPTVFDRLAAAGLRVGLLEWLVTWPPQPLPEGFVATGWMRRDGSLHPPDLFERAGVEPWRFDWPRPAFSEEEVKAELRDEVVTKPRLWQALARRFDPQVGAVTFYAVDRASHRFWREAYPGEFGAGPTHAAPAEGSFLREIMTGIDAAVGSLRGTLGPDDVLLVASDHGFQADPDRDHEDAVWVTRTADHLGRVGLDPARDGFVVVREWGVIVVRITPGPVDERDTAMARVADFLRSLETEAGEPLLRVNTLDVAERPPGLERPWWRRTWQWGIRQFARIVFGERFEEPAHGWVFGMTRKDRMEAIFPDGAVRIGGAVVPVREIAHAERFNGTHHPTAVFLAAGGPLRAIRERQALSVLDVAPLVTYLAGQPIPDDFEGALPEDWIAPERLAAQPPLKIPAAEAPLLAAGEGAAGGTVDDAAMTERLRALGYVE